MGEEMSGPGGSPHRSLYKQVGSPPWKEAFRLGCLERMRNSRERLLNKYRQAGGNMPLRTPDKLLVQEIMEEEWNSLQSKENCPEPLTQSGLTVHLALLEEIQQELIDEGTM
ncbi:RPA-interacting protein isoform X3 [Dipodomys spectabilis]|uniref:RPA-interacting protein isoform X3 n=1 Tax=Dipodomys spectabilis TaxID=105255 RepID=UPI001C54A337|nr:RPA-interacting protein isoform X3 [Dipodomys spectabilis]